LIDEEPDHDSKKRKFNPSSLTSSSSSSASHPDWSDVIDHHLQRHLMMDKLIPSARNSVTCAVLDAYGNLLSNETACRAIDFESFASASNSMPVRLTAFRCLIRLSSKRPGLFPAVLNVLEQEQVPGMRIRLAESFLSELARCDLESLRSIPHATAIASTVSSTSDSIVDGIASSSDTSAGVAMTSNEASALARVLYDCMNRLWLLMTQSDYCLDACSRHDLMNAYLCLYGRVRPELCNVAGVGKHASCFLRVQPVHWPSLTYDRMWSMFAQQAKWAEGASKMQQQSSKSLKISKSSAPKR
jgi:hypothetical protein